MKIIQAVKNGDVIEPGEPLPTEALRIVCDGEKYTVYEEGDEIPE